MRGWSQTSPLSSDAVCSVSDEYDEQDCDLAEVINRGPGGSSDRSRGRFVYRPFALRPRMARAEYSFVDSLGNQPGRLRGQGE